MSQICVDYEIGDYQSHKIVSIGYEDLNLVVTTERGQHFAKLFSSARKPEECQRYVSIMEQVLAAGISHPKLYDSP